MGGAGLDEGPVGGEGGGQERERGDGDEGGGCYRGLLAVGGSAVTGLALEDGAVVHLVVQGEGLRVGDRAGSEDAKVWAIGVMNDGGNTVGVTRVVDETCDSSLGLGVDVE